MATKKDQKSDLVSTVWVKDENSNPVSFAPGDDVPEWARKQMGDHCFAPAGAE